MPSRKLFKEVAESYLQHGGEGRYLKPLLEHFGDKYADEITPFDIKQLALSLYPQNSNSSHNRGVLAPARAILMHGYERGWCPLIRIKRFKEDKPAKKVPASHVWLHIFARQCTADGLENLAAIVLFMSQTGARISEAIRLKWADVDLMARKAVLLKTKTDTNSVRYMTEDVTRRLFEMKNEWWTSDDDLVFRYQSRFSVNDRIKAVCERAGIPYKSPHLCGRHAMATNAIALGLDVKTVMDAGGWKSPEVFLGTYVHTYAAGRTVADRFNSIGFSD